MVHGLGTTFVVPDNKQRNAHCLVWIQSLFGQGKQGFCQPAGPYNVIISLLLYKYSDPSDAYPDYASVHTTNKHYIASLYTLWRQLATSRCVWSQMA